MKGMLLKKTNIIKAANFASCVAGVSISKTKAAAVKTEVISFIYDRNI